MRWRSPLAPPPARNRVVDPTDTEPEARLTTRFLLDEGIHPSVAERAWALGLDASSVHEIRRVGLSDWEQLALAAREGRVLVTRNRRDLVHCTSELCRSGEAHAGVLLVPWSLPNDRPDALAHALKRWAYAQELGAGGFGPYHVECLAG